MSNLTTQQIRTTFIDYFKNHGHAHIQSSELIPYNDPSLMFVNAGMVQFKDIFTGVEKRDYCRATTSQKCIRAGGKHNDLDNVGYTARHHTFFEMLGNFSFGDYFKEESIYYAWTLLTQYFSLAKDKLYITVYHDDDEAASSWKKISGFGDDRIIRIKTNDNFWSMGDIGPCGPSTEIFYDHGEHIQGGLPGTPEEDGDRFVEIWNLVFMQYEQVDKDNRILLPNQSVDTGMGLERIAAVLQGVHNNYETDIFQDLIANAESILKVPAVGEALFSYRVIADHLRSSAFLIADGVMPSNEGRGYVLRRIMRRAMRHAHQLGAKEPLMYKLLPQLEDLFGHPYTELTRAEDFISSILQQEEERFKSTLDRGLKLLEEETISLASENYLSGEVAFKLYDTYGFPLDLTEDILKKKEIGVDKVAFNEQMQLQKERARKAWSGSGEKKTDVIWFDLFTKYGSTEFLGYSLESAEGKVIALLQQGKIVEKISKAGEKFTLIANQTPFYGESGGQMGDIGWIKSHNSRIEIVDTLKFLGKIIGHICILQEGEISCNDEIKMAINRKYRNDLKIHHTATHILHAVMRDIIGNHVTQKGSLVANNKLRFDFSNTKPLSKSEIKLIEKKANEIITHNSLLSTKLMSKDEAIKGGAMALFGEKYESEVRVVSFGPLNALNKVYSFELCGGTHVKRSGDIGVFKIIQQGAVAAGIRRVEVVCGEYALDYIRVDEELMEDTIDKLKCNKLELVPKIESLLQSKKEMEKQIETMQMDKLSISLSDIEEQSIGIDSVRLLYNKFSNIDIKALRIFTENLSKKYKDLIIIYATEIKGKSFIVIAVSKNISDQFHAGSLAKKIANIVQGKGGGQTTLAQIGGGDVNKLSNFKQEIKRIISDIS